MSFRAGFIALLGLPNAGKSTLLNRLLGSKLSIVSPKPQTTRHKITGIVDGEGYQACFLDTPGWLSPKYGLQRAMLAQSQGALLQDADAACLLVEPGTDLAELETLLAALGRGAVPLVLGINKTDIAQAGASDRLEKACLEKLKPVSVHRFSAKSGQGVGKLLAALVALLPEQPAFYPQGQYTDRWERFYAGELIREAIFELYQDEIPYSCAVAIDQFCEEKGRKDLIRATIYIERDSQKPIILGKGGQGIRRLSEMSRKTIEAMLGRPVDLELWVKVKPKWRDDPAALKEFGY